MIRFESQAFEVDLTNNLKLGVSIKVCANEAAEIRRGELELKVEQVSAFKKDRYEYFKDIVLVFTKQIAASGERIRQRVPADELDRLVKFPTFLYDDFVHLEVFHRNTEQKNSKIGKAFLQLREIPLNGEPFVVDLLVSNYGDGKGKDCVNGQLALSAKYTPR